MENSEKRGQKKQILLIGIIIAVVLIGVAGYFFMSPNGKGVISKIVPTPTLEQEAPTMLLSFVPNTLTVTPGGAIVANVELDSYTNPVSGVTVSISYDPREVENAALRPVRDNRSALSAALNLTAGTYDADPKKGIITETFIIPKNVPAPNGRGVIAKFTGTLKPGVKSTVIKIDSSSKAVSSTISRVVLGKVNLEVQN